MTTLKELKPSGTQSGEAVHSANVRKGLLHSKLSGAVEKRNAL